MAWRERETEVTQINVSTQTTVTSSSGSLPDLRHLSEETDRDRVTGKTVSSTVQHPVSRNRDRNTSHHTQVVEAAATRVRWQYDSVLQGAERTEQGRQLWQSALFCFFPCTSSSPLPRSLLPLLQREKIMLRTGQRDSCRRSSSIHMSGD